MVATGAAIPNEKNVIDSYLAGHSSTKGMFAVDAGSTQGVAQAIQAHNLKGKVKGGGYDLTPITQNLLASGYIQFTIDQQPYLQGFFPIIELYLYNVIEDADRHGRRQHRSEVPGQHDGEAVQHHQEPVRGHQQRPWRHEVVGREDGAAMTIRKHR